MDVQKERREHWAKGCALNEKSKWATRPGIQWPASWCLLVSASPEICLSSIPPEFFLLSSFLMAQSPPLLSTPSLFLKMLQGD